MLLATLLIVCLIPVMVAAIPPPQVIRERNLEADLIVIGEVVDVKQDDETPNFVVRIEHIIKGPKDIDRGNQIKVLFRPSPSEKGEIGHRVQGMDPVRVQVGSLVVVYLEQSPSHPGLYRPLLEGLSVVTIRKALSTRGQ
jgi:hypothetical protein